MLFLKRFYWLMNNELACPIAWEFTLGKHQTV